MKLGLHSRELPFPNSRKFGCFFIPGKFLLILWILINWPKKRSSNESDFMRKFLVKIRKCKKIDLNASKDPMITCVLHISSIKSINHSPPPWYSQYFNTFCYSRESPIPENENFVPESLFQFKIFFIDDLSINRNSIKISNFVVFWLKSLQLLAKIET